MKDCKTVKEAINKVTFILNRALSESTELGLPDEIVISNLIYNLDCALNYKESEGQKES